jgi:uncharacterized protein (DUF1501 family)
MGDLSSLPNAYLYMDSAGVESLFAQTVERVEIELGESTSRATKEKLGVKLGLGNQVTAFTASDFGRTLTSNSNGTDHGWGSHHFVVGGAVQGQDMYGQYPVVGVNQANDVGAGRLIPTTTVDQYAGTLVRWFGLSDGQIGQVFPNLGQGNFGSNPYLGFMG